MGGPGFIVEIDESKVGHRKYNRGKLTNGYWVLGMYERGTGELRIMVLPNNNRSATTLLPLIQQHVLPGTTVMTDEWRAYRTLPALGYQHSTVNHSVHFVDPFTGAHTQNIESQWRPFKRRLCRGGIRDTPASLERHIAEYLWRREIKKTGGDPFVQLITDIVHQYPV